MIKAFWSKGPGVRNSRSSFDLRSINVKKLRLKKRRVGKLRMKNNKNRGSIVRKGQLEGEITEIIVASEVDPNQSSAQFFLPEEEDKSGHGNRDGDIEKLINGTLEGT